MSCALCSLALSLHVSFGMTSVCVLTLQILVPAWTDDSDIWTDDSDRSVLRSKLGCDRNKKLQVGAEYTFFTDRCSSYPGRMVVHGYSLCYTS